jgi:eukaryotic-like serine/threonine-protein kinase
MKASVAIPLLVGVLLGACGGSDGADQAADQAQETMDETANRQLAWVDRSGEVQGTVGPRMNSILDPSIEPGGDRIVVRGRETEGQTDYLYMVEGANARRLTDNEGFERHMIWSPDGARIAYSIQNPGGVSNLYVRAVDGSGGDQPVVVSEGMHKWYPSWTPDGETIVFHTNNPETQARDLWYADVSTGETGVLVDDDGIQALARLSRDGNFVAYQSDQTGETEIWVTTFPTSDERWQVSTNGGTWPKWSDDQLFYWEGNTLMAVDYTTDGGFSPSAPEPLFTGAEVGMGADNMMDSYNPEYDVTADGTRFVVTQRLDG